MVRTLTTPSVPKTGSTWSQAVQDGEWLFISGQVAMDGDGRVIGPGDCTAQADEIFRRIGALLEAAGGGYQHIRKVTVFVTDIKYRAEFAAARGRYLCEPYPASTLVAVSALIHPDLVVEVDAVARIEDSV